VLTSDGAFPLWHRAGQMHDSGSYSDRIMQASAQVAIMALDPVRRLNYHRVRPISPTGLKSSRRAPINPEKQHLRPRQSNY